MADFDQLASGEEQNKLILEHIPLFKEMVIHGIKSMFQSGYFVGQDKARSRIEELQHLLEQHDYHVGLVLDPMTDEVTRHAAQRMLMREATLATQLLGVNYGNAPAP